MKAMTVGRRVAVNQLQKVGIERAFETMAPLAEATPKRRADTYCARASRVRLANNLGRLE